LEVEDFDPKINPISIISISGEVNNPGNYTIEDGETLSSIITKAGGYTNQSYPPGGILIRESIKDLEEASNLRTYNELVKVLAQALSTVVPSSRGDSGPRLDGNALALLLSELKDTKPTGRLTVEFDVSKIERDMEKDTVLKNGDSIHIPEFSKSVHVFGEVINPGTRQYDGQRNINQYVKSSGGITTYGDSSNIVVIKPNGDAFIANDGWLSWNNTDNYILPGSVIYVPRKFDKLNNLTLASAIAPIVSSLALSLASLDSIND
jgi:protein involved in polysaccharide export with SLBB domain